MMTILRTPWAFMAAMTLAAESAIRRGGEAGAAKGDSEVRRALSAMITAAGGVAVMVKAVSMSALFKGVPVTVIIFLQLIVLGFDCIDTFDNR